MGSAYVQQINIYMRVVMGFVASLQPTSYINLHTAVTTRSSSGACTLSDTVLWFLSVVKILIKPGYSRALHLDYYYTAARYSMVLCTSNVILLFCPHQHVHITELRAF